MKWLITGANGQLGRCLQKTLISQGIDFVAFSHADLDITNISQLKESINSIKPDVVINAAAYTNVEQAEIDSDEAFRINQLGAANVAIASKSVSAKLVHFSTDYVFAGNGVSPWRASDLVKCLPINPFAPIIFIRIRFSQTYLEYIACSFLKVFVLI